MNDPLRNSKDPLLKTGPGRQMELFRQCSNAAHGFTTEDVIAVGLVLVVNALRQTCATRQIAEMRYDEMVARYKGILNNHYDALGRKRGVFAYDQNITLRRHG